MQDVEIFTPGLEHTAELGRICFEAFRQVSEGHGFERDFPDAETVAKVIGLIQGLPGNFQVAARVDDRLLARTSCMPLMTLGPTEEPSPVWLPSIAY